MEFIEESVEKLFNGYYEQLGQDFGIWLSNQPYYFWGALAFTVWLLVVVILIRKGI